MIGRLITLTSLNRLLQRLQSQQLARPERFELPTPRFEAWCSIQLSYGRRTRSLGSLAAKVRHCLHCYRRLNTLQIQLKVLL